MLFWIAGALALIGAGIVWWVKSLSGTSYDADGNMWLIAPMLLGWALIVLALALAIIGGGIVLFRHINFH